MHQSVIDEKIQRAIDRDRRGPLAGAGCDQVDHLIGAERLTGGGQNIQNAPAARRQVGVLFRAGMTMRVGDSGRVR